MKLTRILPLLLLAFISTGIASAQVPAGFNYQGIARNASGTPLSTASIGMRITIRNGSAAGVIVYQETHSTTTNAYGLFNVAIGGGTVVTGTLAGVAWGTGNKFIQVEIDPAGGTTYTNLGATQLLSVPYAMYAGSAGSATLTLTGSTLSAGGNSITLPAGNTYTAGTGINISATNVVSAQTSTALWNASQIQGFGVSTNAPSTGQVLIWSGSAWVPNNLSTGGSFSGTTNFVAKFTSGASIGNSLIADDGTSIAIGTSSLSAANKFQVVTSSNTAISASSSSGGTAVSGVITGSGGGIAGYFDAGANGKSLIVPNGRIGIGTTTPTTTAELKSTRKYGLLAYTDTLMGVGTSYDYNTFPAAIRGEFRGTGEFDGSGVLGVSVAPDATFGVGVTGVGNFYGVLGIGTDSGKAAIYANAHSADYGVFVQGTSGTYAALQAQQSGSTYALFSDGTSYFNGSVQGVGTYSYTSDRKLKKDIQPIGSALATISRIKPSTYTFRTGNFGSMNLPEGKHYGVIAQELQEVLPELVTPQHFRMAGADKKSRAESVDYLGVNYNELIPILIKGMQEQQAIIEKQQSQLDQLEKRLEALEKK